MSPAASEPSLIERYVAALRERLSLDLIQSDLDELAGDGAAVPTLYNSLNLQIWADGQKSARDLVAGWGIAYPELLTPVDVVRIAEPFAALNGASFARVAAIYAEMEADPVGEQVLLSRWQFEDDLRSDIRLSPQRATHSLRSDTMLGLVTAVRRDLAPTYQASLRPTLMRHYAGSLWASVVIQAAIENVGVAMQGRVRGQVTFTEPRVSHLAAEAQRQAESLVNKLVDTYGSDGIGIVNVLKRRNDTLTYGREQFDREFGHDLISTALNGFDGSSFEVESGESFVSGMQFIDFCAVDRVMQAAELSIDGAPAFG